MTVNRKNSFFSVPDIDVADTGDDIDAENELQISVIV